MTAAAAHLRITRLAAEPAVHRAFRWLHLHQLRLEEWQMELLRIPAPTFEEAARAAWALDRFRELGLSNVHLDAAGNALAELPSRQALSGHSNGPTVLLSAHLDTVFPAGLANPPTRSQEGRIHAPGACDNAAGLSALLGLAAAFLHAELDPGVTLLFAANVCEEGQGDLRGMRHLFAGSPYAPRIRAAIALEGAGSSAVITSALASRRFRITITGPGGHAWTDAGTPNPILQLARALLELQPMTLSANRDDAPRTTLNIGLISGGTSINSIPASATAHLDLRSTHPAHIESSTLAIRAALERSLDDASALEIEAIGDRPGGALPDDSPLLETIRAVDRHLSLRTRPAIGSTDANIPLALGVPAVAIGTGGAGGGIHTLKEWYDPAGRETALRRILLTLLDTARQRATDDTADPPLH